MAHLRMPLYHNAYALILSDGATSLLGLVYWTIAARAYSAEQVGYNSAAIAMMTLLSGLASIPLKGALVRFIPEAGQMTRRLVAGAYGVSALAAVLCSLVFLLGTPLWGASQQFLRGSGPLTFAFTGMTVVWSLFALQDTALTGLRQTRWVPVENVCFAILKIILLLGCATLLPEHGIFLSWSVPALALLLPVNLYIFRRAIPAHASATLEAGKPLRLNAVAAMVGGDLVGAVCGLLSTLLLPVIVISQLGAQANAYFYLAWIIAYPLMLVSINMTTSLTVETAGQQAKLADYSRRTLIHAGRLLAPAIIVIACGAHVILRCFGPEYAAAGTPLLQLLALAAVPYGINIWHISLARVQQRTKQIVATQVALCTLTLGLSTLFLGWYGITGVGVAWLTSQSLVALVLSVASISIIRRTHEESET